MLEQRKYRDMDAPTVALLVPPERYEVDSPRLNWPLDQLSGVPGLPDGTAIMPTNRSHSAVLRMACASGKTFTVRRDLVGVAGRSLVVVVTCNRLFTKATCKDWSAVYGEDKVFCYLDGLGKGDAAKDAKRRLREMCERRTGVLFVSIESFLVLNGIIDPAAVGAMVLEETCELASKMLSATCPCVRPFRLLREVATSAERIIYTDADFEADGPTDGRCLRLAKYLCPDLPVCIFSLSRSAEHTKRSVKLYFDHAAAEAGVGFNAWLAQLQAYLSSWRRTGDAAGSRVAVACANRAMVRRVCSLAYEQGCFWCDYTSDTDDLVKMTELADPETHWVEIALVAFTQTLSVGADPKEIQFAAVFLYAAGFGCTVRALVQGVLRFGRDERYALRCKSVFVCMKGQPSEASDEDGEGATDFYQAAFSWLMQQRAERTVSEQSLHTAVGAVARADAHSSAAMLHAYGGVKNVYVAPTDEELGIAAWAIAEQWEQRAQLFTVLKRTFVRHVDVNAACSHAVPFWVAPVVGVHLKASLLPRREPKARVVKERHHNRWLGLTVGSLALYSSKGALPTKVESLGRFVTSGNQPEQIELLNRCPSRRCEPSFCHVLQTREPRSPLCWMVGLHCGQLLYLLYTSPVNYC